MRRTDAGAPNLEAAEWLAADVLEKALEKSSGQRVDEIIARSERGDKTTVAQPRDHEAVFRGIAEIRDEHAPALRGEVSSREREAGIEGLIGKDRLAEPGKFLI